MLPDDVRHLMDKLSHARPNDGIEISAELADALGIREF
ncbi:hypothetical protein Namu_2916 [Nakamurella multipartita DSM 44233]|uniref:Uncharacterized protein n=1 Tax=Nakamurella multipartita (strain ATCC 700099 / DSM 44233 / CIP 104796 / JCM 9543 / NBRC 105858 / Y-104) TaxID=479431 RepID=C8X9U7_NAKMY|nr:hypothetical protein Namu_2916 [Nakamurella multipartita DSM 44233]